MAVVLYFITGCLSFPISSSNSCLVHFSYHQLTTPVVNPLTHSLSLSHTHTHTQSDNHVEYVFDAGSEREKEKWITIIRSHSSRLCHQNPNANGHLEK